MTYTVSSGTLNSTIPYHTIMLCILAADSKHCCRCQSTTSLADRRPRCAQSSADNAAHRCNRPVSEPGHCRHSAPRYCLHIRLNDQCLLRKATSARTWCL